MRLIFAVYILVLNVYKIIILSIAFFALKSVFIPCHAQPFSEYNFKFKTYTVKNGLVHDKVNKVLQDSKGFLWIATEGGLSRFDGYTFKNFTHESNQPRQLPHENIIDFVIDSKDILWLAFGHSFCSFNPSTGENKFYKYRGKNIECQKILYCDEKKSMYLASRKDGLFVIHEDSMEISATILSRPLKHNVTSLYEDSKKTIWITIERNGFYKYAKEQDKYSYIDVYDWPMFVHEDTIRHCYYTGTWLGEFMIFDGHKLPGLSKRHVVSKFEGYENCTYNQCILAPKITGDSILWVSTHMGLGLFNINENKFVKYIYYNPVNLDGISTNWLSDLFISKDGSLWISSWHGLQQVNPDEQFFTKAYIPELDINMYNLISGIADDPEDKNIMWMSVNGTGLVKWDKQRQKILKIYFKDFLKPEDTNYDKRWTHRIHQDSNQVLWVSTYGGFIEVKDQKVHHYNTYVNQLPVYGNDSYMDNQGMLWLMGQNLILFNPYSKNYQYYNPPREEKNKDVFREFICMTDGNYPMAYVGTNSGLYEFDKEKKSFKKIKIQYPESQEIQINNIRTLAKSGHKLFFGTYIGLFCYNILNKTTEKILDGYFEYKGMIVDKTGALWVFSSDGLYKINPDNYSKIRFDQNDGIYTLSIDPITFFEYREQMYIGFRSLFTTFDPGKIGKNLNVPTPFITEVLTLGNEFNPQWVSHFTLPYDSSDISFVFTALEYSAPNKLQFSYFLEGLDKGWSKYAQVRTKSYTNLPPGKYTFHVKAIGINGVESNNHALLTFEVSPAYWQTWWFQLLLISFFSGLVIFSYRYRVRVIQKRESEKTRIQTKMAELDEKLLRSQMNPHFIFNSLNSIQKFIWESKEEMAAEYVASFAKLMRGILENSRKKFTTLSEEFELLKLYIDLEHRRSNGRFDYHISIDQNLEINKVKILPLILQPFIENAIWHGLNKKEEGGQLYVDIRKTDEKNMEVSIEDNGVGRNQQVILNKEKSSLGQSITNQRLEKLMEVTKKNTNITIIDLINAEGKASGTRVIISLPIIYEE